MISLAFRGVWVACLQERVLERLEKKKERSSAKGAACGIEETNRVA